MTAPLLTPTTELEAVNALLSAIGESPVETLLTVLPADAGTALASIRRFSRQLQKSGWSFNSEENFPLSPNTDGEIILPLNTLKVDPSDPSCPYVQRGGRLYDPVGHTYNIGQPVKVDIVFGLDFYELPETARNFIVIAAGRRFEDQFLGADNLHNYSVKDEQAAWAEFVSDEAENEDLNVLDASLPSRILRRRSRSWA
ncbi:hypothetical protein [Xanthobacter sp. NFH-44]|uniref:hypothetical protein n=1 Tax=unclassified Xanthobacter TaxID=2623496 RepID=UPI00351CF83E